MRIDDDRYQEALDDWRHDEWRRRYGFDPTSIELEVLPEDEEEQGKDSDEVQLPDS